LSDNRHAGHNYHLLERFEAGLALTGTEVKAAKSGRVQLKDSFAEVASRFQDAGGPYLYARVAFGRFMGIQTAWMLWLGQVSAPAANANLFADSTWIVRPVARDAMFATPAPGTTRPDTYARLRNAKTILIETDQYDVYGDNSVVIKFAPGHTPGHQMLLLRLKNTGPVLLSGDLYHFPQERTLNRFPVFEFDKEQTRRTRIEIDGFLKAHIVYEKYTLEDFEQEQEALKSLGF